MSEYVDDIDLQLIIESNATPPNEFDVLDKWKRVAVTSYERPVAIAYPRNNYYVFYRLDPNDGWVEDEVKWQETYERALSTAQTLANKHRVPFMVKERVDL